MLVIDLQSNIVAAKLQALQAKANNLAPVFQAKVMPRIIKSVITNFQVGGRPPWKPLAASTLIAWIGVPNTPHRKTWFDKSGKLTKKAVGYVLSRRPLWDTGALVRSVRPGPVTPQQCAVVAGGGAAPYAPVHQFGALAGKNKKVVIPARPYMVLQPEDRIGITDDIAKYLLED